MILKPLGWIVSLLIAIVVAACGGGGSGGSPVLGGGTGGSSPAVASLQIKFSPASVDNSGTQPISATITALDASGQGVAGVPLTITIDSGATYAVATTGSTAGSAVTGANGTLLVNVTIGDNATAHTVTMKVVAGSISKAATFDVLVSKQIASDVILVASSDQVQNSFGNTVTVTVTAVDGNRNALPNIPVTFSVDQGATIVPSGTVTGANGTLTGSVGIGSDQSNRDIHVTATSGTKSAQKTIKVVGAKLTSSGFTTTVSAGAKDRAITYLLVDNVGRKMSGYDVVFSVSGQPDKTLKTDAGGEASFKYDAPTAAGVLTLTLTGSGAGVRDDQTVTVSTAAVVPNAIGPVQSASLSASPNVVAVNTTNAPGANTAEIRALFLSNNNVPVGNVRVWFDLNGDQQSIGGTLASTLGHALLYSDANGVARTTYAPGARFSPKDGVVIRACWAYQDFSIPSEGGACPLSPFGGSVLTTLTAISDSLSVSIGTNNLIGVGASTLTYTVRYAVQVVDSAGQAKVGVKVSPSIDLLQYFKGFWTVPSGSSRWIQGGKGNAYPARYPLDLTEGFPNAAPTGASVPAAGISAAKKDNLTFTKFNPDGTIADSGWRAGHSSICDNEDLNRNGVSESFLDFISSLAIPGNVVPEDQNNSFNLSSGRPALDPRKADVTISVEGADTTDSNGIVVLKIEYPQNIGSWVSFNILVAASGVAGTEGRANFAGVLPVPAIAVNTITASPPFEISPYGVEGTDTYLRKNAQGQSGWLCTYAN